eukprot:CAMPEP_0184647032 /NCGR_PEP_ID=MMETSP0308-20130426/3885_1 /TAXON_ID=38269 /ORGANISM="Gloeochaete witrockiana, Strain SAG 46.84" /LENGTH=476 /DNA_ID=CAMNT_0027077643 /DNA_START=211 /DNA_END=1641 /DNA_ORIENTATION=-
MYAATQCLRRPNVASMLLARQNGRSVERHAFPFQFARGHTNLPTAEKKIKPIPIEEQIAPFAEWVGVDLIPGDTVPDLTREQLHELLTTKDPKLEKALFAHANSVSERYFGNKVYFRGIVEFSNVCQKNCGYCGVRKDMPAEVVHRYSMDEESILECAEFCFRSGYGSIMLQSGELNTDKRIDFVCNMIRKIKDRTRRMEIEQRGLPPDTPLEAVKGLGVALSIGELPTESYQKLYDAGAHRYLLRIETSNPELYSLLHPADHSWQTRLNCLMELKRVGFQIGTGIMIALPGQTMWDLADDLLFFKWLGADMIGMGPYVFQEHTPVGDLWKETHPNIDMKEYNKWLVNLTTRMYACARILMGDSNIPATTALQAIDPVGREVALGRGANVLMPILTPTKFRKDYQLYQGKPCIDEGASECRNCLINRVKWAGKELALGIWGDPPRFFREKGQPRPQEVPLPLPSQKESSTKTLDAH